MTTNHKCIVRARSNDGEYIPANEKGCKDMKDDEYIMIQSDRLLDYVKSFFGDVVVNAWVASCGGSLDYAIDYALKDSKNIKLCSDGDLEWCNMTIVFEFSNGKRVAFDNSEWAFISAAGDNYKEVKGEST